MGHNFAPPATPKGDTVDLLHGVAVPDPYRWLEDSTDPDVIKWTREQNDASSRFLSSLPGRGIVESRLSHLLQVEQVHVARVAGERIFTVRRERGRQQPTLFVRDGVGGEDRPLIDLSAEDASGTLGLDWWRPSRDGSRIAYGVSRSGHEWSELRVRDVATGEDFEERIPRVRSASIAWFPDGSGFYYTRYPQPGDVPAGKEHYFRRVFRHELGRSHAEDPLVWGEGRAETELPSVVLGEENRWLVINVDHGWSRTEIFLMDLQRPYDGFRDITPPEVATHEIVALDDGVLYSRTHSGAPNGCLMACHLEDADAGWSVVIPEREGIVLEQVVATTFGFVSAELENAVPTVRRYARDGSPLGDVALPEIGSIEMLSGAATSDVALVLFSSFVRPATLLAVGEDGPRREVVPSDFPAGFDPEDYEIAQEWFTSRDGTSIPMFVASRRDIARDGSAPAIMHGYGGFRVAMGSVYWPDVPVWLEQGGVYAVPCLRGGGEFGMAWHQAGMLERKQSVFDDVIAAAEHLIDTGLTSPERLGLRGTSNGGLLVGAAITQRPELFRAVRAGVPLMDMLRYHLFQIARIWIPEYGSAEDPDQFAYLSRYSPYHRVRDGVVYPATLVTGALNDSRVDPMHARKMAARLQEATAGGPDRPILLRIDEEAGHGAGKPLDGRVIEAADTWAFFGWALGMDWQEPNPAADPTSG